MKNSMTPKNSTCVDLKPYMESPTPGTALPIRRKTAVDVMVMSRTKGFWKLYMKQRYEEIKPALPYLILFGYWFLGAFIFHVTEKAMTPPYDLDMRVTNATKCIGMYDYWGSIFYVLTVSSTIGFGSLYACTVPTKILTIIYSLCGLPQMIFVLSDMGKRACCRLIITYKFLNERRAGMRQKSEGPCDPVADPEMRISMLPNSPEMTYIDSNSVDRQSAFEWKDAAGVALRSTITMKRANGDEGLVGPDIPIWLGFACILFCVLLTATYFHIMDHYSFPSAIYYAFLFFLAGDFNTEKHYLTIPTYLFLFFGFATVSTTISIVLYNIENMMRKLKKKINLEIIERQENKNIVENEDPEELIEELMHKHVPTWLRQCIPEARMTELVTFCQKEAVRISQEYATMVRESECASMASRAAESAEHDASSGVGSVNGAEQDAKQAEAVQTPPPQPPHPPPPDSPSPPPPIRVLLDTKSVQCTPTTSDSTTCAFEPVATPTKTSQSQCTILEPTTPTLISTTACQTDAEAVQETLHAATQSDQTELASTSTNTSLPPDCCDKKIQMGPTTRTVKTQYPIGQYLGMPAVSRYGAKKPFL